MGVIVVIILVVVIAILSLLILFSSCVFFSYVGSFCGCCCFSLSVLLLLRCHALLTLIVSCLYCLLLIVKVLSDSNLWLYCASFLFSSWQIAVLIVFLIHIHLCFADGCVQIFISTVIVLVVDLIILLVILSLLILSSRCVFFSCVVRAQGRAGAEGLRWETSKWNWRSLFCWSRGCLITVTVLNPPPLNKSA